MSNEFPSFFIYSVYSITTHQFVNPPVGLIVNVAHSAQLINAVVEWKVNPKISYKDNKYPATQLFLFLNPPLVL